MPTHPRNAIYREGEIGIYHCWSRCVQRAHLCGQDTYTGMDFHYRRPIIEALLKYQAGIFGVDLANYNVLSNHMHLVVRTRPDVVDTWDDERVARRWKLAWPKWDGHRWMREPTEEEIQELLVDKKKLATARRGLSSLSWFLARCKEPLARHFNQEMQTRGHFWEARFGSREIMDEAALLACMIYVDTNQIKAGMAKSLEESECSAIAARLKAAREREAIASLEEFHKSRDAGFELSAEQIEALFADAFLSPISANGPLMTETVLQALAGSEATTMLTRKDDQTADGAEPNDEDKLPPSGAPNGSGIVAEKATGETPLDAINRSIASRVFGEGGNSHRRASDNPVLPMSFTQYREIVEWVVAQTTEAIQTPASVPDWLVQYLRTHGADPTNWLHAVDEFQEWFGRAVGSTERLRELLERTGNRWIRGMRNCRATFG